MAIAITELTKAISSLEESVDLYNNAKDSSPEKKAFRDACIQRFEYTMELSWKLSVKLLGSTTTAAKVAVREMAQNSLIVDANLWLQFVDARNSTSHSYDENVAKKVFDSVVLFLPEVKKLTVLLERL